MTIGQFELIERIGRGGMGEVWRGFHIQQGVPVAIKVMTAERARKEKNVNAFRNEVHAMARLNHPGIVRIFDSEIVPRSAEAASFGNLVEGSPTVTMELATHGTLEVLRKSLNWDRLRTILFGVLDGLSHAHARGVIHRDLKPGNILVTVVDRRPQLKLADFGLAHATGEGQDDRKLRTSGTPRYMAPEQVEGRLRDQGPWTDLYALGCVVYYLLNGSPPFSGTVEEVLSAHLYAQLPKLEPSFEVPDSFFQWLNTLMAKDRSHRFTRAADAAYELFRLQPDSHGLEESISDIWEDIPNEPLSDSALQLNAPTMLDVHSRNFSSFNIDTFQRTISDIPRAGSESSDSDAPIMMKSNTPIPLDWRRPTIDRPSPKLIGAGLALYGLRPIPFVGRERERDVLWSTLRNVRRDHELRFVEIRGPMGAGKSRLSEWFAERAHEVGGATPLIVTHNDTPSPSDGLMPAFRRALKCENLNSEETFQRIRQLFFRTGGVTTKDLHDCVALTELFAESGTTGPRIRFGSPTERYVLLRRLLRRFSHERPVLLVIDDAQWGLDALQFVEYLGEHKTFAAMVIATVRDEASRHGVQGRVRARRISENEWAQSIELSVLETDEHRQLVGQLLPLSKELETAIVARTAGNPLFAVQLIGDWVQREILELADDGFTVHDRSDIFLPDSMHDVWVERIQQLSEDFPGVEEALHVAAVLGLEVDATEWNSTIRLLDIDLADDVPIHLVQQRLAVPRANGWAFSHAMFREALIRNVHEQNHHLEIHRAISEVLAGADNDDPNHQLRIAQHLLGADRSQRALPIYIAVCTGYERTSAFQECLDVLDQHDHVLSELETAFEDPAWAESLRLRATCLLRQGDVAGAKDTIEYAVEMSQNPGWESARAELVLLRASLARKQGDSEGAIVLYREARDLFGDDLIGRGRCEYGIGEMRLYQGDVDGAIEQLSTSVALMNEFDEERTGVAVTGLASAYIRKGEFELAREQLDRAVGLFAGTGNRSGRAAALNMIGEMERTRKNWDEAARAYSDALEILESVGSWATTVPRLNLALIRLAQKDYAPARELIAEGVKGLERAGEYAHLGFANIALCVAEAGISDWPAFTKAMNAAKSSLENSHWKDIEIAEHAEAAGTLCLAAGQKGLAAEVLQIAESQFDGLKMNEDAARVREIVSNLFT